MDMQELICQAHMAGQKDAGCSHPSWSNALAYFLKLESENLSKDIEERAEEEEFMSRYEHGQEVG